MFDPDQKQNQKRMLALDGGGIMGMLSLQFLKRMEDQLRPLSGKGKDFRLCDFFDYFGGTSTGAIIAAGLAIGKSVDELTDFYEKSGRAMFTRAPIWHRLFFEFDATPLAKKLKEVIGDRTVLEMHERDEFKSLLMVVMRNAKTDSPWPLTTNPDAKYNHPEHPDCNMKLPLWQLVRASTAAPTFFRPEIIMVGKQLMQFVDGGVTPYNNPAFLLYKVASLPQYRLGWLRGEDRMMLVSVGTGLAYAPLEKITRRGKWLLAVAKTITGEVMRGIQVENDINCRTIGRCVHGAELDLEIGNMVYDVPLETNIGGHFLYARYDADVSKEGLKAMGFAGIDPKSLTMDNVGSIKELTTIGRKAAELQVDLPRQFAPFMPRGATGLI